MKNKCFELYGEDCLDVMFRMQDSCVDLIFTSPPYAMAREKTYGGISESEYADWLQLRCAQMCRILRPTGSIAINIKEGSHGGERSLYVNRTVNQLVTNLGLKYLDQYIWLKTNPFPGKWKARLADSWESIYHFSNNLDIKFSTNEFNLKKTYKMSPHEKYIDSRIQSKTDSGFSYNRANFKDKETREPTNVIISSTVSKNTGHSAAFPESLPEFFIRLLTDEGDAVLDPFVGSGTTIRVAKRMGRVGIGIDINNPSRDTGLNQDQEDLFISDVDDHRFFK